MPELATRLPCPVCLGVMMERVGIGPEKRLMVDVCRRCGGAWLEHGTVQPLRAQTAASLSAELVGPTPTHPGQCHSCHAPLDRDARVCAACGRANLIDCPRCDQTMRVVTDRGLRLDVCTHCKGAWFDRHELASIWTPRFDAALARRDMTRGDASAGRGGVRGRPALPFDLPRPRPHLTRRPRDRLRLDRPSRGDRRDPGDCRRRLRGDRRSGRKCVRGGGRHCW